ncbi:MAG: hypothetical protein PHR77_09385 [Kiritimatiellae bacterium]|nr:hypothetical protein [Kiritimatiellia bacterium]MDD5522950.1 hypothetical protein [Kiritimatiellia bacterium]
MRKPGARYCFAGWMFMWLFFTGDAFGIHNSLFIRERLRAANSDPFYLERRDPHRGVQRDPKAMLRPNDLELKDHWRIEANVPPDLAGPLREDVSDFLRRMNVKVSQSTGRPIRLRLNKDLAPRAFHVDADPNHVEIQGGDAAGLWAGVAWCEREMGVRRGPFLPQGKVERQAAWRTQVSQGPWGGNYSVPDFSPEYLSDDAFRLYAHYGVNSMMIYGDVLCYAKSNILPELNCPDADKNLAMLKDAAQRAARYGVRFTYVPVGAKLRPEHQVFRNHPEVGGVIVKHGGGLQFLCSCSKTVHKYYEEMFSRLSENLAGVILITGGESWYHCRMWDWNIKTPCPQCSKIPVPEVTASWVEMVDRGLKRDNPEAFTAQWIYNNTGYTNRVERFKAAARQIGVFHAVDKDYRCHKEGYTKNMWDYSIDCAEPTPEIKKLAAFSHETGRPFWVKTETGSGLEVFQFPYVPAMQHLAHKWEGVRSLRPVGVHQSWLFFGMAGTRAEELGFWATYEPEKSAEQFLHEMAVRDFGPEAADQVLQSWAAMSRAVTHLPEIQMGGYYIGPMFLGPCYPMVPSSQDKVPEVFYAYLHYLQENEETFSVKQIQDARTCLVMRDLPRTTVVPDDPRSNAWDLVTREFTVAAKEAEEALHRMQAAAKHARTEADHRQFQEETDLTELLYRTWLTCANTVEFLRARHDWEKDKNPIGLSRMQALARQERENAVAALPIFARSRWLDPALRLDGGYRPAAEMLREKIAWLDRFLSAVTGAKP